jgi:hypothetical protein
LKESKLQLFNSFPERILGSDSEQLKIVYEKMVSDDSIMMEIESIIDYSIPLFEHHLKEGRKIYEFIEEHTRISPVGLIPLNNENGYLFLSNGQHHTTYVYTYSVTIYEHPSERFRSVHIDFIEKYEKGLLSTYETIKCDLLKANRALVNPATYVIECSLELPFTETFLPIAKRTIMKKIANAA